MLLVYIHPTAVLCLQRTSNSSASCVQLYDRARLTFVIVQYVSISHPKSKSHVKEPKREPGLPCSRPCFAKNLRYQNASIVHSPIGEEVPEVNTGCPHWHGLSCSIPVAFMFLRDNDNYKIAALPTRDNSP